MEFEVAEREDMPTLRASARFVFYVFVRVKTAPSIPWSSHGGRPVFGWTRDIGSLGIVRLLEEGESSRNVCGIAEVISPGGNKFPTDLTMAKDGWIGTEVLDP